MEYGFDLDFDQMPTELLSLLPLTDWSTEYEMPVEDLLFECSVEFTVEEHVYEDVFGYYSREEEVIFEGLKINDVPVDSEFWDSVIPSGTEEDILNMGPEEFLY